MLEIGYFHVCGAEPEENVLITSYGAEEEDLKEKVLPHFRRYKEACASIGWQIKIAVTPLSYVPVECLLPQERVPRNFGTQQSMEAKPTQEDKATTEVEKESNVSAKEEMEGAPVAPGTNIAGSIEKMEHQIAILNKELEKIRAKLVEARKEEIENSTDEAKRYGAICILRQALYVDSHTLAQ